MSREYRVFLLRLWRNNTDQLWRASLQAAHSAERYHFADLTELIAYLEQHAAADSTTAERDAQRPDLARSGRVLFEQDV